MIDKGRSVVEVDGVIVGAVGVCEKGYLEFNIELETTAGHTSRPADHTGIGITSQSVVILESDPFMPKLTKDSPLLDLLQVVCAKSKEINNLTRELYLRAKHSDGIRSQLSAQLANYGVKINSLPEKTTLGINHQISMDLTAQQCVDRVNGHVLRVSNDNDVGAVLSNGTVVSE